MRFLFFASLWSFFVMLVGFLLGDMMAANKPDAVVLGTCLGVMAVINALALGIACISFFVRFANKMIAKAKKKPASEA